MPFVTAGVAKLLRSRLTYLITTEQRVSSLSVIARADGTMFIHPTRSSDSARSWTRIATFVTQARFIPRAIVIGRTFGAFASRKRVTAHSVRTET